MDASDFGLAEPKALTPMIAETSVELNLPNFQIEITRRHNSQNAALDALEDGNFYVECFNAVKGLNRPATLIDALRALPGIASVRLYDKRQAEAITVRRG